MKKLILLIVITLPFMVSAQKLELTPKGLVDASDTNKAYLIIDVPKNTQTELYKSSLLYLSKQYVSPQYVLTRIDGESIIANYIAKRAVFLRTGSIDRDFDINSTVNFDFKDGKIRISYTINRIFISNTGIERPITYFFNKKDERRDEESIVALEKYINGEISKFIKGISNTNNW